MTKTPDTHDWYFTFLCQPACSICADLRKPQHIFNLHLFKSCTCCFPWSPGRGGQGGSGDPKRKRWRRQEASCWPQYTTEGQLSCLCVMGQTMKVFSDDLNEGSISSVSPHDFSASRGQHQECGWLTHFSWQTDIASSGAVFSANI